MVMGPEDLSKNENENDWAGLKEWLFSKWIPADSMFMVVTSFLTGSCIMISYTDVRINNILIFHICPNLRPNFWYYRRLEHLKMIFRISNVFGSRDGVTEILTMKFVRKCQFLSISENWTNVYELFMQINYRQ